MSEKKDRQNMFKKPSNILIVDDAPDNLHLLSNMLQPQGYQVRKAISGKFALKGVHLIKPDLILLDISMPEMDGYEVCEKLKSMPEIRDIPVIFISALDNVFDKVKAFEVGGVDYITKPFQSEEVLARVKNQLALRELQTQLVEQNALLVQEIESRQQSEARERDKAQELEFTLEKLKQTQAQLIQAEKMSIVGQTVVGFVNKINQPINSIHNNIPVARQYFQDLMSLIEVYKQTYSSPTPEIQNVAEKIDLDFLVKDWKKLINSLQLGAESIQEMVLSLLSLRSFSRLDELELKSVDIHEELDNALLFLQPRLKAEGDRTTSHDSNLSPEIKVIKDYGRLPKITCYGEQLNQVFVNLLNNAIDALLSQPDPRVITIRTELGSWESGVGNREKSSSTAKLPLSTQSVVIRIADNGLGISEAVQKKIFDPFFTTKAVEGDTGLGLSISYQIVVNRHGGKLWCNSVAGQGTEFVIELPIAIDSPALLSDLVRCR